MAFRTIVSRSRGIVRVEPARPGRLLVQHPLDEPRPLAVREGRAEGQQLVERQAQAVHVAAPVGLAPEPLRGHVPQGPHDIALGRQLVQPFHLGQAEVGDPGRALRVEQEVRRLDVAVQDPLPVRVGQCLGDLHPDPGHAAVIAQVRLGPQLRVAPGGRRRGLDPMDLRRGGLDDDGPPPRTDSACPAPRPRTGRSPALGRG